MESGDGHICHGLPTHGLLEQERNNDVRRVLVMAIRLNESFMSRFGANHGYLVRRQRVWGFKVGSKPATKQQNFSPSNALWS